MKDVILEDKDSCSLSADEALSILEDKDIEWLIALDPYTFQGRKGEVSYFINDGGKGIVVCIISQEREVSTIIRQDELKKQKAFALFKSIQSKLS